MIQVVEDVSEHSAVNVTPRFLSDDALLAITVPCYLALIHVTYVGLRLNGTWLYFASNFRFDPEMLWLSLPVSAFVVAPLTFLILSRSKNDPFALAFVPLVLLGAAPGAIVICLSGEIAFAALFLCLYLALPALLLFAALPGVSYPRLQFRNHLHGPFLLTGAIGVLIFLYLILKYHNLLSLASFDQVYVLRGTFRNVVEGWEKYAIAFAKFVSTFSLLAYAITIRRAFPLAGIVFIFMTDYMLDGNKLSIAYMLFSLIAFFFIVVCKQKYQPYVPVLLLCVVQATICIWVWADLPSSSFVVALYDRGFNVSATLFAKYFDYAHSETFLYGGNGLLGRIFGGVPIDYYVAIGEKYFGPETSANADMISDAYINFGMWGVVASCAVLRLCFDRHDIIAYSDNREVIAVFMFPYCVEFTSVGLQTAMITGGFAFGLLVLKVIYFPPAIWPERPKA